MLNKVENIVAKGETAHYEQFLLWPQCFQKSSAAIASKCVYRLERVKTGILPAEMPNTVGDDGNVSLILSQI